MATKTKYTSYTLLHKKFPANVKGYDANEVDKTLDEVIQDYKLFENNYTEAHNYISRLEQEVTLRREENNKLRTQNTILQSRLDGIKDDTNVSRENIDLIQRIRKLEKALYEKGVDPTKIK